MCGVSECAINTLCLGVSLYKPNGYQTMKSLFIGLLYITDLYVTFTQKQYPLNVHIHTYMYTQMLESDYPSDPITFILKVIKIRVEH